MLILNYSIQASRTRFTGTIHWYRKIISSNFIGEIWRPLGRFFDANGVALENSCPDRAGGVARVILHGADVLGFGEVEVGYASLQFPAEPAIVAGA